MTRAPRRDSLTADYEYEFDEDDGSSEDFFPGERMCQPRTGGGNTLARVYFAIFLALGAGWVMFADQAPWRLLPPDLTASVSAMIEPLMSAHKSKQPVEQLSAEAAAPSVPAEPPPEREIAEAPGSTAGEAAPPAPPPSEPTVEEGDGGTAVAEPLPPPKVDPADPYQKKAVAVGLHPDISRTVLAKLSADDYRNARVAVETALRKIPDAEVFEWPQQRKPDLALFRVHFVAGAPADCRRYVVTITKDRWSTTAPAMEKCGGAKVAKRGGKAPSLE